MTRATFCVALLAVGATVRVAAAPSDPAFDGVWEGTVNIAALYGMAQPPKWLGTLQPNLRIQMRRNGASVKLGGIAFNPPGGFQVQKHDAAASIYTVVAQLTSLETIQISLTKTEDDKVLAYMWRVLNWKLAPPEGEGSKSAFAAVGELTRSQTARRGSGD